MDDTLEKPGSTDTGRLRLLEQWSLRPPVLACRKDRPARWSARGRCRAPERSLSAHGAGMPLAMQGKRVGHLQPGAPD